MTTMYKGIPFSPQVALGDAIGAADTVVPVTDVSAFPDAPNYATIGTDETAETILYSAKTDSSLSGCTRGVEGTAKAWSKGTTIARNFTAVDLAAVQENMQILVNLILSAAAGTVTTGAAGSSASVTVTATEENGLQFSFTIPRGDKGETGSAATIEKVTATTGEAGTEASVTNSGTSSAAVFEFVIPRGDKGETGETGATGEAGRSITNAVLNSDYTLTLTFSDNTTYTTPSIRGETGATGEKGEQGDPGSDATVTVDSSLSSTSTNPVQNSVIYEALSVIYEVLEDKQDTVTFATSLSTSTSSAATPYLVKNAINRSTNVSAADTNYSTYMARGEALFSSETTPSYNGQIAWQYE